METTLDEKNWPAEVQEAYEELEVPSAYELLLSYEKLSVEVRKQNQELKTLNRSMFQMKHHLECIEEGIGVEVTADSQPTQPSEAEEVLISLVDSLIHLIAGTESTAKELEAIIPSKFGLFRRTPLWRDDVQNIIHFLSAGNELVHKKIASNLGQLGIEMIAPTQGEPFDPTRHRAVEKQSGGETGTIASIVRLGFLRGGSILRYADVSIFE